MTRLFSLCKINLCCLLSLCALQAKSQKNDSAYYSLRYSISDCRFKMKELYVPVACIALGSYSNANETFIDNGAIKAERDESMPHFHTGIDNYMQYAPLVAAMCALHPDLKQMPGFIQKKCCLMK